MKSNVKNLLCTGAVCLLLVWTACNILREQTPGQLAAALLTADWRVLLLGVPLMALRLCCEAAATCSILRTLGCGQPFRRCFYYSCTGFFFSTITPSAAGGQPAQVCAMGRDGVPAAVGTLDMLLVTIGYSTAVMGSGIVALAANRGFIERLGGQVGLLLGVGLAGGIVLDAAMLLFLFFPGPARRLLYRCIALAVRVRPSLDRVALEAKADDLLAEYSRGSQLIRRAPGLLARVLGLSALQLACTYGTPYMVYRAFGLSGYSLGQVLALQTMCSIAVGYLPLPGAAGAAESVFLRSFLLIFGRTLVAPAMILSRTLSCYLMLTAVAVILAVGRTVRRHAVNFPVTMFRPCAYIDLYGQKYMQKKERSRWRNTKRRSRPEPRSRTWMT